MLYSLSGKLSLKKTDFVAIDVNGIGFKVWTCLRTFRELPKVGDKIDMFCHFHIHQNGMDLYGFLEEKELDFFELLLTISGIGPKAALKIMEVMKVDNLLAAVSKGRTDLLTKAAGIGAKKAARIILELSEKINSGKTGGDIEQIESNMKIEEALKPLGYKQNEIREAIKHISPEAKTVEEKLKESLRILGGK